MSNIYAESMTLSRTDGTSVSVTDAPDSARAGLESGLLLTSLKIRLSSMPEDELVAAFTLNADFSFSGLKSRASVDREEKMLIRHRLPPEMETIGETVTAMHSLFGNMRATRENIT